MVDKMKKHPAYAKLEQLLEVAIQISVYFKAKRLPSNETESVNLLLTDCTDRITCMSCGQAVPGGSFSPSFCSPSQQIIKETQDFLAEMVSYTETILILEHVSEAVRNTVMLAVVTLVAGLVFKFHPKIAIGFYKAAWTSVLKFLKGAVYQPSFNPFK